MSNANFYQPQFQDIQVCSISLNYTDTIYLFGVPADVTNSLRTAILNSWGTIQNEGDRNKAYEFKLKGNPWKSYGEDLILSRKILKEILKTMAQHGWNLVQTADISRQSYDKDTLFFEKGIPDKNVDLLVISFNWTDTINIIDSPSILPCLMDAIESQWPKGIQSRGNYYGAIELKLKGNPWRGTGSDVFHSRMVLCQLLANVRTKGYKLYGSINITIESKGRDLDSWFFRKVGEAWQ